MVTRGEVGGGMGEVGEVPKYLRSTSATSNLMVYGSVESLYCTPETNITLYPNYTGIKFFKKRYRKNKKTKKQGHWLKVCIWNS